MVAEESASRDIETSLYYCNDCQRPTVHYAVSTGVPVCGSCGATPVGSLAADVEVLAYTTADHNFQSARGLRLVARLLPRSQRSVQMDRH